MRAGLGSRFPASSRVAFSTAVELIDFALPSAGDASIKAKHINRKASFLIGTTVSVQHATTFQATGVSLVPREHPRIGGISFVRETVAGREEKHAFRYCPELAWRALTIANSCALGERFPI